MQKELLIIERLLSKLRTFPEKLKDLKAFVGFDGFIDTIQKPVHKRVGNKAFYYEKIPDLAERIASAAGKSTQIEMVTQTIKLGGNAPIMSNALSVLGFGNYCIGALGEPLVDPVFAENMPPLSELIPVSNPGLSYPVEFSDGKLILSDLSALHELSWAKIKEKLSIEKLKELLKECSLIALVDWTNLAQCSSVWKGILEEVIPELEGHKCYFFDLTDISKKTDEEVMEVLGIIIAYSERGKVFLGLNENEANQVFKVLQRKNKSLEVEEYNLSAICQFLFQNLKIHLIIHPIDRCLLIHFNHFFELKGRLVKNPLISTGGGDNFNAGFCTALMAGCNPEECMIMAMVTSGAYVEQGKSPDLGDIENYLIQWRDIIKSNQL